jgi:hypothetical protein
LASIARIAAAAASTNVASAARGSARERLDPQRARAGEQVEHACVRDPRGEDGEQRLAHAVRGRPRVAAGRRLQRPPSPLPGNDTHHEKIGQG